jgi:hypothetical protein
VCGCVVESSEAGHARPPRAIEEQICGAQIVPTEDRHSRSSRRRCNDSDWIKTLSTHVIDYLTP